MKKWHIMLKNRTEYVILLLVFLDIRRFFSLDLDASKYIKRIDMPYVELKEWLNEKRERQGYEF